MKSIASVLLGVLLFFLASACRPSNSTEEMERVRNLLERNVHAGDQEDSLIAFFKTQGWNYTFDKWKNSYLAGIDVEAHGDTPKHTVTVQVVMTESKRVKDYHVGAAWK